MSFGVSCNFMDTVVGSNYNSGRYCTIVLYRQMFVPIVMLYVGDDKPQRLML